MEVAADSRFATFQVSGRQMGEIDHRKKEEIVKRLLLFHVSCPYLHDFKSSRMRNRY